MNTLLILILISVIVFIYIHNSNGKIMDVYIDLRKNIHRLK